MFTLAYLYFYLGKLVKFLVPLIHLLKRGLFKKRVHLSTLHLTHFVNIGLKKISFIFIQEPYPIL